MPTNHEDSGACTARSAPLRRPRQSRLRRGLATLFAAGLTASLLAAPANAQQDPTDNQRGPGPASTVTWGPCPDDVEDTSGRLQCATVEAPKDYDEPDGDRIEVMISRLASQKPQQRRGVLLLNPGGPGGAGLSQPADLAALGIPRSVLDSYDLIGVDPRGVGHSTPVTCGFTDEQGWTGNIPPYAPHSPAVAEQARTAKAVADQCAANDPEGLMAHISTANTARDLNHIRAALGERKASFFGVSYGTALGSAFASMFPEQTDRVVIDSNLGTTSLNQDALRRFGLGMEDRFVDFAHFAAERHDSYGLGRTPAEVRGNYFELAERLDRTPVAGVDGASFRLGIFVGLYSTKNFAQTAQLWQSLAAGNAERVPAGLAEDLAGRGLPTVPSAKGTAGVSPLDNGFAAFQAVTCNDTEWPEDVAGYQRAVARDRIRYPMFGAASANINPCAYWHHEPGEADVPVNPRGPENVLVVQNLRDPATPHLGGQLIRKSFGARARLVSIDQGGHGAYVYGDNPCGLNVTTNFLVDGTFPAEDTFCGASRESGLQLDPAGQQQRQRTLERIRR